MAETVNSSNQNPNGQLVPVSDQGQEVSRQQPRSPEENLGAIASTASDLYARIEALPSDLPEDPHATINTQNYGGRGVFIGLKQTVVELQDGNPAKAEHWYDVQVRSTSPDPDKPYSPGDPFSVSLSAESSNVRGLQFRMAGSTNVPDGVGPNIPTLRAMDQMTEMTPVEIQEGVDGILAELGKAVAQREQLAESLRVTPQA
jgi:hypothetical protein